VTFSDVVFDGFLERSQVAEFEEAEIFSISSSTARPFFKVFEKSQKRRKNKPIYSMKWR